MDALTRRRDQTGITVKQLVLDAIGQTYGYWPAGTAPADHGPQTSRPPAAQQQTAHPVPKPGGK